MNRSIRVALATLALICISGPSWSKGAITRIVIDPTGPGSSIEITDPNVLATFTIWSGPGVAGWDMAHTTPNPGDPTFLIEWPTGPVSDLPPDLKQYKVTMYVADREAPGNRYEVLYRVNSSVRNGYIYLPGPDDDIGRWNTWLIYREVEGNWFRASQVWEAVVKPLIYERAP
jgi:hypothetical protein